MLSTQASPQVLTFFEYQVVTKTDFSLATDFEWLCHQIELNQMMCCRLVVKNGQPAVVMRHYLAVILLPSGVVLEILPKINAQHPVKTRQWVQRMLMDVYDINHRRLPILASTASHSVNQALTLELSWLAPMIEMWLVLLAELPLPSHYQPVYHNHPQAQGRLLIKQQIRHNFYRPHYRYTSQDDFFVHPLWQRFFYTVWIQLCQQLGSQSLEYIKTKSMRLYTHTTHTLSSSKRYAIITGGGTQPLDKHQWQDSYQQLILLLDKSASQLNPDSTQHILKTLRLSWLLLNLNNHSYQSPIVGTHACPAVMIDMQSTFEKWVSQKLKQKYGDRLKAQMNSVWLTSASNNQKQHKKQQKFLQPDIVIRSESDKESALVADIKYKLIQDLADVSPTDLYQLYTYAQHWQAKTAWLIFPKTDTFFEEMTLFLTDNAQISSSQDNKNQLTIVLIPFDVESGTVLI